MVTTRVELATYLMLDISTQNGVYLSHFGVISTTL